MDDVRTIVAEIPLSRCSHEYAALVGPGVAMLFTDAVDRWAFPWRFPDPDPMPQLHWWPWLDASWWTGPPREAWARLTGAWEVLRFGVPERDDDWVK